MLERHLSCLGPSGFHRLFYSEWQGPPGAPTLICVHGFSRNAHDFDLLAAAMAAHCRVVCPDMPGRGRSEWLSPQEYGFPLYLADCAALIARLDVDEVDWVGTSMGGLIGMMLAAQRASPIRRLVLNDVGAYVAKKGLNRLGSYVGTDPTFPSLETMESEMRKNFASFGALSDAQWRKMSRDSARERPQGGYAYAYDPRIADPFKAGPVGYVDLWGVWDKVRCPTLLLRGRLSDMIARNVARAMTKRGPKAKLVEFAGAGHAPALIDEEQIGPVRNFLLA